MLLTGGPKGIEIFDRSQKIIQRGGGKFNIAATESMGQCRIDVFENLETVAYAGQSSGWNIKRSLELFTVERGKLPFEMNPVDTPRGRLRGSILMRFIGRQNKAVVRLDRILVPVQLIPAFAIGTIDQNILRNTLFPNSPVQGSLRIVTDIGHIQHRTESIQIQFLHQQTWYDQCPAAFKSVPHEFFLFIDDPLGLYKNIPYKSFFQICRTLYADFRRV